MLQVYTGIALMVPTICTVYITEIKDIHFLSLHLPLTHR